MSATREEPTLEKAETPVAALELSRVRENARRVSSYCRAHGLSWRPHVKTHKSRRVARIELDAGAPGLTVATPREAEIMAQEASDLLLAYPPVGATKIQRVVSLPPEVDLKVALDSEEALDPLARAATERGREVGVLVEVDVGLGRVGVTSAARAVELARRARTSNGVAYRGILFYPGHIRTPQAEQDQALKALSERLETLYEALGKADLAPEIISGGSSPTLWQSHRVPGLTEVRAGTCIFMDRDMVSLGVCTEDELAYSVLATVVSTAVAGQAIVDAGSKALAKEPTRSGLEGFGAVLGRPEVTVASLSEEHGILDLGKTEWRPGVGDRVRLVPNHVCVSANLHERYLALEGEEGGFWPLDARGRAPGG